SLPATCAGPETPPPIGGNSKRSCSPSSAGSRVLRYYGESLRCRRTGWCFEALPSAGGPCRKLFLKSGKPPNGRFVAALPRFPEKSIETSPLNQGGQFAPDASRAGEVNDLYCVRTGQETPRPWSEAQLSRSHGDS